MQPVHSAQGLAAGLHGLQFVDGGLGESELGEMLVGVPFPDDLSLAVHNVDDVIKQRVLIDTRIFGVGMREHQHLAVQLRLCAGGIVTHR